MAHRDLILSFALQIQHAEISIMRASFILTHRPGKSFKFMDYTLASLDDDCAKVTLPASLLATPHLYICCQALGSACVWHHCTMWVQVQLVQHVAL